MSKDKSQQSRNDIKLLIVDDSWVLRRVLRGTLSQRNDVKIVGEASNGVEALEMILGLAPDVILLDVEMPVMDGMTTLQHLMIQTPTPTIMLSGLSKPGGPRCFDALKYGAVDFVSKDSFFKGIDGTAHNKLVLSKIFAAAETSVSSIDPMRQVSSHGASSITGKVVFCEECGTRNHVKNSTSKNFAIQCKKCNDDIDLIDSKRHRRMDYLTIIGAGKSGYGNLLQIIPELNPEMSGAILVMILDEPEHVESFAKYLDSISDLQVVLGKDGNEVENGCCYLLSGQSKVSLSPYSGQYSLKIVLEDQPPDFGAIDNMMESLSPLLGKRLSGVLLSGEESDGIRGMQAIFKKGGRCMVLTPDRCLHKTMVSYPSVQYNLQYGLNEAGLAIRIQENHLMKKEEVITA